MLVSTLIYDVGARIGEDSEYYLKKGFSVIAIEAVPEFCDEMHRKFKNYLEEGQLKVLNLAISNTPGMVDFYVDEKEPAWGTTSLEWVARNRSLGVGTTRKITVKSSSLGEIMKEYGVPRYCKIDIEGDDLDALVSLKGTTEVPQFISIESDKRSWRRLLNELVTLRELGYRRFKIVNQELVDLQECPNPPLEGEYCHHVFQRDSSGLFGDELPGKWIDFFEAVEVYKEIFRGYALNGDNGIFTKLPTLGSIFELLGRTQARIAHFRGLRGYINPAEILPPPGWYDTHAAR
jgi:FkbM family methyltransferase